MDAPVLSVVIPVLGEEEGINACLAGLFEACDPEWMEVLVVDGDQAGGTLSAIDAELLDRIVLLRADRGRARQMNAGAAAARGETILFLHADTRLSRSAVADMLAALEDPSLDGGAFSMRFDGGGPLLAGMARLTSWRSRLLREPFGDQAIFVRARVFREAGGYPDIPLMEEVAFMRGLRKERRRIRILGSPAVTSSRRFAAEGTVRCLLKDGLLYLAHALGVDPGRLKAWYPDFTRGACPGPAPPRARSCGGASRPIPHSG